MTPSILPFVTAGRTPFRREQSREQTVPEPTPLAVFATRFHKLELTNPTAARTVLEFIDRFLARHLRENGNRPWA